MLQKLIDIFMFREKSVEDTEGILQPVITTGSIVWGALLRTAIIVIISFFLVTRIDSKEIYWISLFIVWLFAFYPAWRQYNIFRERITKFTEETLCGSCRHFDEQSQLCKIFDEHPTEKYIPCEGLNWEPVSYEN